MPKTKQITLSGAAHQLLRKEAFVRNSLVGKVGKATAEEKAVLRASAKQAATALTRAEESAKELKKIQAELQDKQRELAEAKTIQSKLLEELTVLAKQLASTRTSLSFFRQRAEGRVVTA